jgi:hypothetical protein
MDAIGVDAKGDLYWHGKAVNVRHRVDLDRTQTVIAIVVAASALVGALAAVAQAWSSYNDWACKVNWPGVCALADKK